MNFQIFWGSKSENKPLDPKNVIWAKKSIHISHDQGRIGHMTRW
jgi:hypothetical protein